MLKFYKKFNFEWFPEVIEYTVTDVYHVDLDPFEMANKTVNWTKIDEDLETPMFLLNA